MPISADEHLPSAPIIEAVLDVHVRSRPDLEAVHFKTAHAKLATQYPNIRERQTFTLQIRSGIESETAQQNLGVDGYFFSSTDGRDVVQFRIDGFALNRLKPYERWDVWFPRF